MSLAFVQQQQKGGKGPPSQASIQKVSFGRLISAPFQIQNKFFFPIWELKRPKNVNKILSCLFAIVRVKMHAIMA